MPEVNWTGPPRKILLATDLSARCDRAFDRAVSLAEEWRAELFAVHALEHTDEFYVADREHQLPSWRRPPELARTVEEQLRRYTQGAAKNISAIVERGEPADVILEAAASRGCDLIVTGVARDQTFGPFRLGTTVDRLLGRSGLPILIVRQRVLSSYSRIVVATDLSTCSLHALRAALAFFPNQKITAFYAYHVPFAGLTSDLTRSQEKGRKWATHEAKAFLSGNLTESLQKSIDILAEAGRPVPLIRQYVHDKSTDLVILGTHGRSALFKVLIGSVASEMLLMLPCDTLLVPQPQSTIANQA